MRLLRHVIIIGAALFLLVGLPVYATGYPARLISGVDATSSASVIIDQPSGAYVVILNRAKHTNGENLAIWEDFFNGREIDYLFEDISCVTASNDTAGYELAKSFQSRLPENQMRLVAEDATLLFSKAYYGRYDCILLSKEAYDAYGAGYVGTLADADVIMADGL